MDILLLIVISIFSCGGGNYFDSTENNGGVRSKTYVYVFSTTNVLKHQASGQYARLYDYVGYEDTGGNQQDSPAGINSYETIVIPYNRLTSSQEGYVHGFRMTTAVSRQPFKVQIWRRNQGSWQADGSWVNSYVTQSTDELNGYYTLVYSTDEIFSAEGEEYYYLRTGVQVQESDFLGFTYRVNSPFYYGVASGCENEYNHTQMTSSSYPRIRNWYTFDSSRVVTQCRTYPFGILLETTDIDTDHCERLNILDLESTYPLTSHDQYPLSNYANNMDVCWLIHSYDDEHYVTFTLEDNEVFELEYYHGCSYDNVAFYRKSGSIFVEHGNYCSAQQFPYDNEIFVAASIVKVKFATDNSRTDRGFQLQYKAVDTDYDPSSDGNSSPQSGASSGNDDCQDNNDDWKWKCLSDTERALLICVIILLFLCILIFVFCLLWYCCYRPREKIEPEKAEEDEDVIPHKIDNTQAIPYDNMPFYTPKPYTPIYANTEKQTTEQRTPDTYGQPKSLRPLSDPLGSDGQHSKAKRGHKKYNELKDDGYLSFAPVPSGQRY